MVAGREGRSESGGAVVTRADFDLSIARLSLLRGAPDDADGHFSALSDIPADVFDRAVTHAVRTRTFFPVPAELRVDADSVSARPMPEPKPQYVRPATAEKRFIRNPFTKVDHVVYVDRELEYDCENCNDTGVESFFCGKLGERRNDWVERRTCDRRHPHASHEWMARCGCWEFNPTLKRRREAQRVKYSEKAGKTS